MVEASTTFKIARFARDLNYEDENGWRKGNGRNPKKEIVLEWRKNNTTGKKIDCIEIQV